MNLAEVINISTGEGVWLSQVLQVLRHEQSNVSLTLERMRVSLQQPTSTPLSRQRMVWLRPWVFGSDAIYLCAWNLTRWFVCPDG